jgi:3-hydroxyacyl-CoA dehydrogenase
MSIKSVGVIGGGTMGAGIIYTLSGSDFPVVFKELDDHFVRRCLDQVNRIYTSAFKKGKITEEEMNKGLGLIRGRTDYQGFEEVDLIIEAVPEDIEIKKKIFQEIDPICKSEATFATNTSALSISELESFVQRRGKFIGMHWFNPPHVMKLVEVVPGLETSEETIESIMVLCRKLNKVPIRLKECAGFLVNRLLGIYVNEAFWMLGEGYQAIDIDQAGIDLGMPMGPFALGDMAGWDVVYHANTTLYEAYGPRFKIPPLFSDLVSAGKFGAKVGQGIFAYQRADMGPPKRIEDVSPSLSTIERESLSNRFLWIMINEAIRCFDEGIANEFDNDKALQLGAGFPKGPLSWADEVGLDWVFSELDRRKEELGERYWPSPYLRRKVKAGHLGKKAGRGFFKYAS